MPDHGVIMRVSDVNSGGLSFRFVNTTDKEILYGEHYALYVLKNGEWELVEPIIENWDWVFNDIGYSIAPNSTSDLTVIDWSWNLGELPSGQYKFQKQIMDWRSPGDFDSYDLEYRFSIQSSSANTDNIATSPNNNPNYADFLRLLKENGFEFQEPADYYVRGIGADVPTGAKIIHIANEPVIIYGHGANEYDDSEIMVEISWEPSDEWYKENNPNPLRVMYSGENEMIIAFLNSFFG
jgi:hypothetical protein